MSLLIEIFIKQANFPNLKIIYDLYHIAIEEANIAIKVTDLVYYNKEEKEYEEDEEYGYPYYDFLIYLDYFYFLMNRVLI